MYYKLTVYQNFDPVQPIEFLGASPSIIGQNIRKYLKRVRYPDATCDGWTIGDAALIQPGEDYVDVHWWRASIAYNESYQDWTLEIIHAPHFDGAPYDKEEHSLDTYDEAIEKFIDLAEEFVATYRNQRAAREG